MITPKKIEILNPKASYELPIYKVTENGLEQCGTQALYFVKGSKTDPTAFRQQGLVTESLIVAVKTYLEENNVGHLESEETTEMIKHLQAVLDLVDQRNNKRKEAGVQGTYQGIGKQKEKEDKVTSETVPPPFNEEIKAVSTDAEMAKHPRTPNEATKTNPQEK